MTARTFLALICALCLTLVGAGCDGGDPPGGRRGDAGRGGDGGGPALPDADGDGIPDQYEGRATSDDTDGDGIPDYLDLDSDGDGIPDAIEGGRPGCVPVDSDGDGLPDFRDLDSDGNGIEDAVDSSDDIDGDGILDFADLDDDGDQDVFEQMGGAYRGDSFHDALYENPGFGRHWLRLELEGVESNRSAFGARVRAEIRDPEHAAATGGDGRRAVQRTLGGGGSFGSNPAHVHLGLGGATRIERLEVRWPGGSGSPEGATTQVFTDVAVDRILALREGDAAPRVVTRAPITLRRGEGPLSGR